MGVVLKFPDLKLKRLSTLDPLELMKLVVEFRIHRDNNTLTPDTYEYYYTVCKYMEPKCSTPEGRALCNAYMIYLTRLMNPPTPSPLDSA